MLWLVFKIAKFAIRNTIEVVEDWKKFSVRKDNRHSHTEKKSHFTVKPIIIIIYRYYSEVILFCTAYIIDYKNPVDTLNVYYTRVGIHLFKNILYNSIKYVVRVVELVHCFIKFWFSSSHIFNTFQFINLDH